jgi:hypothetical protein
MGLRTRHRLRKAFPIRDKQLGKSAASSSCKGANGLSESVGHIARYDDQAGSRSGNALLARYPRGTLTDALLSRLASRPGSTLHY